MNTKTIEQKAKAYDEALEKAKFYYNNCPFDFEKKKLEAMFPELAENEDERIRKHLIARLKPLDENDGIFDYLITKDKVLAWLEKKEEQKPVQDEIEREYVRMLKSLISDFLRGKNEVDRGYYQKIYDWLDGRHIEQKPVEQNSASGNSEKPNNPAVWSEEDEKKIVELKTFIAQCNGFNRENRKKAFDMIDALRPQPRWKPSEEQMDWLGQAILNSSNATMKNALRSLYEDLKKL